MAEIQTSVWVADQIFYNGYAEDARGTPITLPAVTGNVVPGTPIAYYSSGPNLGKYGVYTPEGANGLNVCAGILGDYARPSTESRDLVRNMYYAGGFVLSKLVALGLDASGIADLGGRNVPGTDLLYIP